MEHKLPDLPYPKKGLAPYISEETMEFHHDAHHAAYVTNLNKLIAGTEYENLKLEEIIATAPAGGIFNNAAQVWNHSFFFNCMKPNGGGKPTGPLAAAMDKAFGSFDGFREQFTTAAATNFGSGWTWLVKNGDAGLAITSTSNAGCPLTMGQTPLLTIDVWEHAYYIDYRNQRAKYLKAFWNLVNWEFVAGNLAC